MAKIDYTILTIKMLLWNGILLGFLIMQKVMEINILPERIEGFVFALVACFEIYVVSFYLIAIITELRRIALSLEK